MSAPKPNIIIFGAGPNVGVAVAKYFKDNGWTVTGVARNPTDALKSIADLVLSADLGDATSLKALFDESVRKLGVPSAVLYNANVFQPTKISDPISLDAETLRNVMTVSALSAYEAARLAIEAWSSSSTRPEAAPPTPAFLFTGNMEISQLHPLVMALGMSKNAAGYMLETAAAAYKGKYRFYFVDERTGDGESVLMDIDGAAHGSECFELVYGKAEKLKGIELGACLGQGEWCWTFVKGEGYVKCKDTPSRELRTSLKLPGYE